MKFNKTFLLIFLLLVNTISVAAVAPTPIPEAENIIFIDLLQSAQDKQLIVYQDGIYFGTFNYSDPILFNPNVSYTILVDEDYIDLIQDKTFYTHIFSRYGDIFISVGILIMALALLLFIFNKVRR